MYVVMHHHNLLWAMDQKNQANDICLEVNTPGQIILTTQIKVINLSKIKIHVFKRDFLNPSGYWV